MQAARATLKRHGIRSAADATMRRRRRRLHGRTRSCRIQACITARRHTRCLARLEACHLRLASHGRQRRWIRGMRTRWRTAHTQTPRSRPMRASWQSSSSKSWRSLQRLCSSSSSSNRAVLCACRRDSWNGRSSRRQPRPRARRAPAEVPQGAALPAQCRCPRGSRRFARWRVSFMRRRSSSAQDRRAMARTAWAEVRAVELCCVASSHPLLAHAHGRTDEGAEDEDDFSVEDVDWAAARAAEARLQRGHQRTPSSADAEGRPQRAAGHRRTLTLG